jgi:hypothetical protein
MNKSIFISYSHRDEDWKDRLVTHLKALGIQGLVPWHDRQINTGATWYQEIQLAMNTASIAILLVSADFLASDFIRQEEVPRLLERRRSEGLPVYPIIVRPCAWRMVQWLESLQAQLQNDRPLSEGNEDQREEALAAIAKDLWHIFDKSTNAPPADTGTQSGAYHGSTPRLPPRGLWAAITGWLGYHQASQLRIWLRHYHGSKGIEQPLPEVLKAQFSIPFHAWSSRPTTKGLRRLTILLTGPAGAGKTRFLHELFQQQLAQADLVVILGIAIIEEAIRKDDPRIIWQGILNHFWTHRRAALSPLTPTAIHHALKRRRVLLVIEDLHGVGPVREVLPFLRKYFETYHRWATHLKLLLTTRESPSTDAEPLGPDVEVVRLEALKEYEPHNFFLALCKDNGVSLEVSAIGEALSQAFATETTRTPLFVVICAWLVATGGEHGREVTHLLQMEASRIFDKFITELYRRSQKDGAPDLEAFRRAYEKLAFQFWPEWQQLTEAAVDARLKSCQPSKGNLITRSFLELNGFLFRSQEMFDVPRLSFPHQAMADYLAAKAMVESQDYHSLCEKYSSTRLEGLVDFLAELINTDEGLLALARDELSAFVRVLSSRRALAPQEESGRWNRFVERSAEAAAAWAGPHTNRLQPVETWQGLRLLLATRAVSWCGYLCSRLANLGPSKPGIEALAAIGGKHCTTLLEDWLKDPSNHRYFQESVDVGPVQTFLLEMLTQQGPTTPQGWACFHLAWSSVNPRLQQAAEKCIRDTILLLGDCKIRELIGLGGRALPLLAQACENLPLKAKQKVSAVVAKTIGRALVPRGVYDVEDNKQTTKVRINRALLVPCDAEIINGEFDFSGAISAVRRRTGYENLMSYYQALVVLKYFSLNIGEGRLGVVFPDPKDSYPEVFLCARKEASLYVICDPTKTHLALPNCSQSKAPGLIRRVAFRRLETCGVDR